MARIVGDLDESDEHPHSAGSAPNFNESMYFNFYAPALRVGGFLRVGNRPNEGYAEATATIFLPDGRVLFDFQRPKIPDNVSFCAGGFRFDVIDATERLRTRYRGSPVALTEPRDMADPKHAFTTNPKADVSLDLLYTAAGSMYGSRHDESEAGAPEEQQFAKAHYEQHMRVEGTLVVDGEEFAVVGHGLRDHSWGPRFWQAIDGYEWLTMNFGDDLGAMVSIVRKPGTSPRTSGVIVRGADVDPILSARIDVEFEANGLYHKNILAAVETRSGARHEIEGRVLAFIPLRNRRNGRVTHVGEGMTEWRTGNLVGYGMSELLRTFTPEDRPTLS